jgi:NAD(P)H-dependent FMN reductase
MRRGGLRGQHRCSRQYKGLPALCTSSSIVAADAVLFVTPEYNRGIPGGRKNVVDWASRPRERTHSQVLPQR